MNLLRETIRMVREVGLLSTAVRAVWRVAPWADFDFSITWLTKTDTQEFAGAARDEREVRFATRDDVDLLASARRISPYGKPREVWEDWFRQGVITSVLQRDGELVGYYSEKEGANRHRNWISYIPSPGDSWTLDTWVAPDTRGQGIHGRLMRFVLAERAQAGFVRTLSTIDFFNKRSLRAHAKTGGSHWGPILYARLLGFTLVRAPGVLRVGRWHEDRPLELPVDLIEG